MTKPSQYISYFYICQTTSSCCRISSLDFPSFNESKNICLTIIHMAKLCVVIDKLHNHTGHARTEYSRHTLQQHNQSSEKNWRTLTVIPRRWTDGNKIDNRMVHFENSRTGATHNCHCWSVACLLIWHSTAKYNEWLPTHVNKTKYYKTTVQNPFLKIRHNNLVSLAR